MLHEFAILDRDKVSESTTPSGIVCSVSTLSPLQIFGILKRPDPFRW